MLCTGLVHKNGRRGPLTQATVEPLVRRTCRTLLDLHGVVAEAARTIEEDLTIASRPATPGNFTDTVVPNGEH